MEKRGEGMKATGVIRRVDELGRVVLPMELRRELDIGERDPLEVSLEGEAIVLRKAIRRCIFCGREQPVLEYRGKRLCAACLQDLHDEAEEI